MTVETEVKEIKERGKTAKGRDEYLKYLRGEKITRKEAMLAMCFQCSAFYQDGKIDCGSTLCPLYNFMPYRHAKDVPADTEK